ncbi:MAG: hypothetical protein LBT86_01740 [Deltaproteobacteria bacterium]|jgi:mannose-6-phosphate isomerase class I|nr:hypothetical protein [Deltaproteobacteria bacterium]
MLGELKTQIYPLTLTAIMAEKIWGRRQASPFYEADPQAVWGEIFLAIKDFGLTSLVANGPLSGKPIHQIGQAWGQELINPPGTIKWPLPLTVWLERTGDKPGPIRVKSGPEFWRVLTTGPESWIGAGEDPNQPTWPQRLRRRLVDPGENYLFPAGLPQSMGPGLTVLKAGLSKIGLETLYDWERRQDIWDYQSDPGYQIPINDEPLAILEPSPSGEGLYPLLQGPKFEVHQLTTTFQNFSGGRFSIICPISGQGRLISSGLYPNLRLRLGSATLIPAGLGSHTIISNSCLTALLFTPSKDA